VNVCAAADAPAGYQWLRSMISRFASVINYRCPEGDPLMSVDLARTTRTLVSDVLTTARAPMLSRRFQQAVAAAADPVKVNVGAGTVALPGWINTDVMWRGDLYLDLTRPWPVPPGSIDRIYADNVIEHFSLQTAKNVLRHCHDALRPGGMVRLATPDLERTVRAYLEDPALTAAHLDRHRRHGYPAEHPADLMRVTYAYHGHHEGYIFDWHALSSELSAAGFSDIRRCETGESDDPAFYGLETRAEPTEAATELIVEARKSVR
jgi:predicted SAM-dependent methyltransferase